MRLATDFIFESFDAGMKVHRKLFEMVRTKGFVTYMDLLSQVHGEDYETTNLEYFEYGWTNLFLVKLEPYGNDKEKWILRMPQIKNLNKKGE